MFGHWIDLFWSTPQVNIRSSDIKRVWELKAECGTNNCSTMSKYKQCSTNDAKATQIRLRCYKIFSQTFTHIYIHINSLSKRWLSIKNTETNFVFVELFYNTKFFISILQCTVIKTNWSNSRQNTFVDDAISLRMVYSLTLENIVAVKTFLSYT